MSNPYEEWKDKSVKKSYSCNQCKEEITPVELDNTAGAGVEKFMEMVGQGVYKPSVFYCTNKQCQHWGLLTKVAIIK